jgi:MoxR-like ATPase
MSKQVDEEQLFGRLELASLIPGNIPNSELLKDSAYSEMYKKLSELREKYAITGEAEHLENAGEVSVKMDGLKNVLYTLYGNTPKINVSGKIPDSEIIFLDEIFKANDGILNSLLTALNERVYTNEGETVKIPAISFFSASNEIPDFNDPAEKILKPLYDRFELKAVTKYVEIRENRLKVLKDKQNPPGSFIQNAEITLEELTQAQNEVKAVKIPDGINGLMDDILCEFRRKGLHISDRKYFNYSPIVQAKAYLDGRQEVNSRDLLILSAYLWTKPEEIQTVSEILQNMCENPLSSKISNIIAMAGDSYGDLKENAENKRAFVKFRGEMLKLYNDLDNLKGHDLNEADNEAIEKAVEALENISRAAHGENSYTYAPLSELKQLQ